MSVTPDSTSAMFERCGKNLNYVLTVAILVARNGNEATMVPMMVTSGVCDWWESGAGFNHREDVFTFNLVNNDIL
jgi:hypothetical protein